MAVIVEGGVLLFSSMPKAYAARCLGAPLYFHLMEICVSLGTAMTAARTPPDASATGRRGHFEEPTLNRSLVRGIEILRAFRPGADLLGNGELAERTGLSRATVSRLVQTLVETGFLSHDRQRRAYRLAAPVLSMGHAMRSSSPVLLAIGPLMRALAEKLRINVGLAVADREDMVYLESIRYNRKVALRSVAAGQRVPIELTSLGRAYLAVAPESQRRLLLGQFRQARRTGWASLHAEISAAMASVQSHGFCAASWQPQVVALASPLVLEDGSIYVLNVSVTTAESLKDTAAQLREPLLQLRDAARKKVLALE